MGSNYPSYQGNGEYKPSITSSSKRPGRMKRLNARLHEDPEFAAQHATERTKAINAKSFQRGRRPLKDDDNDYLAAIADFTENEDCSPAQAVPLNPCCIEIARQFNKTPQEVAKDINRAYIDSYRR